MKDIDVCLQYGYSPEYKLPFEKTMQCWEAVGETPIIGEAWDSHNWFHQSAARNIAARQGTKPIILFVDADMAPSPEIIPYLEEYGRRLLTEQRFVACVNWRVADPLWPDRKPDDPLPPAVVEFMKAPYCPLEWEQQWKAAKVWANYMNTRYGPLIVPRRAFEASGGYCEEFIGWGCEDDDFQAALEQEGYKLLTDKDVRFLQLPHTRLLHWTGEIQRQRNLRMYKLRNKVTW